MSNKSGESTSTYGRISSLGTQLRTETRVTARREAGRNLLSLLSDHKTRSRLFREACSRGGVRKGRAALAAMWRVLIKDSIAAAERGTSGKSKLMLEDVVLPYKLLILCDRDEENSGTNLSSKEILALLKYCLETLTDEKANEAGADFDLLRMLHHLCSRSDYVAHYRPKHEISYILAELQDRLSSAMKQTHNKASGVRLGLAASQSQSQVLLQTAKAFAALMEQTSVRLRLGMHVCLAPCMELVSNWCNSQLASRGTNSTGVSGMLAYMYSVATNLMATHPEQCVEVMKRVGRPMLTFAKSCYPMTSGFQKDALIEYFSAHL
eukprot:scaffold62915_cov55-Attheya_sp.AAC.2